MTTTKSHSEKILSFLQSGRQLTLAVAEGVLGVPADSVRKRIHDLREDGFVIYTNKKRMKGGPRRGEIVTAYRLDNSQQSR